MSGYDRRRIARERLSADARLSEALAESERTREQLGALDGCIDGGNAHRRPTAGRSAAAGAAAGAGGHARRPARAGSAHPGP
ncbi:MAG: hypothetical protein MZW92_39150 [Comamonadaceae bacterium]|nr:hypothetical protein [Comamonadaceae bacterium]